MRGLFARWRGKGNEDPRRLPTGQSLTDKFPVLHCGAFPSVDLGSWDFRIYGLVEEERVWTYEVFMELPRTKIFLDIHCVTRWSKLDPEWEGVSVKTLVEEGLIRPKPEWAIHDPTLRARIHREPPHRDGAG